MKVEIDSGSGFCFGVDNAVEIAEKALDSGQKVFCLGSIVHNEIEVDRLKKKGLITVDRNEYATLKNCHVLIRAHGEPPSTYDIARENSITIIEATCPIVKKLQDRIRIAWKNAGKIGGQVVIFGKEGHAEVVGLMGQTDNHAIVINSKENIKEIDFSRPVYLFSQTTMKIKEYSEVAEMIRERMDAYGREHASRDLLTVNNTICGQVSNREPGLRDFCKNHDVIIFVSGRESSNGKMLYSVCKEENPDSYMIASPSELKVEWFEGKIKAGVCGATSTPKWLIEEVAKVIRRITS